MQVKVKYEETVERERVITIDDDEFLEYANETYSEEGQYASVSQALDEDPSLLQEFLEEGEQSVWVDEHPETSPFANRYDQEILSAEVP